MDSRNQIISAIVSLEWEMFQQVKSAYPVACQNNPGAFQQIRGSIFDYWPIELLNSYRRDLLAAKKTKRNLITEKYARMDNLIPPLKIHPYIERIVAIEAVWQSEIKSLYPALYQRVCRESNKSNNGSNFCVYLRSELETYGDQTLKLYYEWVQLALKKNQNHSLDMLQALVQKGGFESVAQAELYFKSGCAGESL